MKTTELQQQFVDTINNKIYDKIEQFYSLSDKEKNDKIQNIVNLLETTLNETWNTITELNAAKETVKNEKELTIYYKDLAYKLDFLFIYTYTLMAYMSIFQYNDFIKTRYLISNTVEIFRQADYLIYYNVFKTKPEEFN